MGFIWESVKCKLMRFAPFIISFKVIVILYLFWGKFISSTPERDAIPEILEEYVQPQHQCYIINFFASWCDPCREEIEDLVSLSKKYNIAIYGISVWDSAIEVNKMLTSLGNPYFKIITNFPPDRHKDIGTESIPYTIIIKDRQIVKKINDSINSLRIARDIAPIITSPDCKMDKLAKFAK
jgi:thiol-disulfide isomerase/thioredoxin